MQLEMCIHINVPLAATNGSFGKIRAVLLLCAVLLATCPGRVGAQGRLDILHSNTCPTRIAMGPDDLLLVSDAYVGAVFFYDATLQLTGELKGLDHPLGVGMDAAGRTYVGNDGRDTMEIYLPDGTLFGAFGQGLVEMPNDLAFDQSGNLYVADSRRNVVWVFDDGGHLLRTIGAPGTGPGELSFPSAVTVGSFVTTNGVVVSEVFVADQSNARIQIFDLDGNFKRTIGSRASEFSWKGRFAILQDIALDDLYRVHALDSELQMVQILHATSGSYITNYGTVVGQLNLPLDLAVSAAGRVLVANNGRQRVEVLYTNEVPQVALLPAQVAETLPPGAVVGTLQLTPVSGASNGFVLVAGFGDADNAAFSVAGSNLLTTAVFDHEQTPLRQIRIKAVNSNFVNLCYGTPLLVTVGNVNEAPTRLATDAHRVPENSAPGTPVAGLITEDPDAGDTFTYQFASGEGDGGNVLFGLAGSNLVVAGALDYESATGHTVRIAATDAGGLSVTNVLAISVTDVGEITDADTDGDGIPDWWEFENTGWETNMLAGADADSDGFLNLEEWIALTDPENPSDHFLIVSSEAYAPSGGGAPVLRWRSADQRVYDIEWATNLLTPFTVLATNLPATPPMNAFTGSVDYGLQGAGYYRVRVRTSP